MYWTIQTTILCGLNKKYDFTCVYVGSEIDNINMYSPFISTA